ncbi:MAG: MAPEG family protein [Steroidobacteraceae bacterium]
MAWVLIVMVLALVQFYGFGIAVGRARMRYGVAAPATTGNPAFERYFRVQMNTLEQLVAFLPGIWLFAQFIEPRWAAALGVVYLVGRQLYFMGYVKDPKSRSLGYALTVLPIFIMLGGVLYAAAKMLLLTYRS